MGTSRRQDGAAPDHEVTPGVDATDWAVLRSVAGYLRAADEAATVASGILDSTVATLRAAGATDDEIARHLDNAGSGDGNPPPRRPWPPRTETKADPAVPRAS